MPKIAKWIGIVLGGIVGLIILAVIAIYALSSWRINKSYTIQPEAITVPTDADAVERGKHLVMAVGKCGDCHGADLAGQVFIDAPPGRLIAPNLTSGQAGRQSLEMRRRSLSYS